MQDTDTSTKGAVRIETQFLARAQQEAHSMKNPFIIAETLFVLLCRSIRLFHTEHILSEFPQLKTHRCNTRPSFEFPLRLLLSSIAHVSVAIEAERYNAD